MMNNTGTQTMGSTRGTALYRTVWRWHFYAGLFCIPFVLMLALSGSIYLFKPQIDAWIDRPYHNLSVGAERASPNEHIAAALQAVPGSHFVNYQLPESPNHTVVIGVSQGGEQTLVYVNPYTREVLKTIGYEDQFIRQVRSFHGELLAGNAGSILVELAGCWAIVLIISGLYLWWPRSGQGIAGILYPRLTRGGRVFWRDLHAVTGIWISFFALFLLISGLPWALVWGSAFQEVRQWQAPTQQLSQQQSQHEGHHQAHQEQDWSLGRAEEQAALENAAVKEVSLLPTLLANAQALNFAPPALLSVSKDDSTVWRLSSEHQNRTLRADAWLDDNGAVLRQQTFAEGKAVDRIIGIGAAAHEGQLFGWFNQLLGLLTTSGLILISITGFVLWRRRKPGRVLGAPPALPNERVGIAVTLIVFGLALMLPLLAVSLLSLLTLEYFVLRRFRASRLWLGLEQAINPRFQ
ncbi:MAG: PepSY domain-containing protein [Cellvibrionaceae bacterium]